MTVSILTALADRITSELDPLLPVATEDVSLDDLIALRLAVKGDPSQPGSGALAILQILSREIDNALYERMSKRKEQHGTWELERFTGGSWRMDGARLLHAAANEALLQADIEADEATKNVVVETVLKLVSVDKNVRVTPLKELFDDRDIPEKFGEREPGAKTVTLRPIGA